MSETDIYAALPEYMHSFIDEMGAQDQLTREHSKCVLTLARELGTACGLNDRELEILQIAALFHDIGKNGIPDEVLNKPARLTGCEWELMKDHAVRGEQIFKSARLPCSEEVAPVIRHHHECYDGTGYPDGLRGEAIPLMSRILLVLDAYDAMTTQRPYRKACTHEQAIENLDAEAGSKFDARLLVEFLSVIEQSTARKH